MKSSWEIKQWKCQLYWKFKLLDGDVVYHSDILRLSFCGPRKIWTKSFPLWYQKLKIIRGRRLHEYKEYIGPVIKRYETIFQHSLSPQRWEYNDAQAPINLDNFGRIWQSSFLKSGSRVKPIFGHGSYYHKDASTKHLFQIYRASMSFQPQND